MLHPRQLIVIFKSTLRFLTGQREISVISSLPVEAVEEEKYLYTMEDSADSVPSVDKLESDRPEDEPVEQNDTQHDKVPGTTSDERLAAGNYTRHQLDRFTASLNALCRKSDPHFVFVGRSLTTVTQDVRQLTDTVHHAVSLLQNDQEENASLKKIETLVQDVLKMLSEDRKVIDQNVLQVKNLVSNIFQCNRMREMIDRINSLFRIVSINIRIQCSVQSLSEEMFAGVSEDLDQLSKKLHRVTKEILRDINQGSKSLTILKTSTTQHLTQMDQVLLQATTTVSKAFYDIRQLMQGTETMIREADSRSKRVADKVSEVVVSIQFHDSLSQRVEHIVHAFEDVTNLCGAENTEITDEHLGTAFIILDLQLRQLQHISKEIKLVRERIEGDFHDIEAEIEGLGSILHDTQFRTIGPQQFLSTFFSSLENTLRRLDSLLNEGKDMVDMIEEAAGETRLIANNLVELKESVSEIREETRVQAVNTIIMASTLGPKGKTIEVLAKEIQTLSDNSSILADDIEAIQFAVSKAVDRLLEGTSRESNQFRDHLTEGIRSLKNSFSEIMEVVPEINRLIEISGDHIRRTREGLIFLDKLETDLDSVVLTLHKTQDKLAPWEDKGTHDSEKIELLIQRYSMTQEHMIHLFDRVDETQEAGDEDAVFF